MDDHSRITRLEEQMLMIRETLTERRRESDKTQDALVEIRETLAEIQSTIAAAKSFVEGSQKACIVFTTGFAALIAAGWAIFNKFYHTP